jgi:uncharacterized protein YcfJ
MALFAWLMMAIALWHFAIFVPDRFWAGIVGAFVGAVIGGVLVALILNGLSLPGRDETDIVTALEAIPGSFIGLAVVYWLGARQSEGPAQRAL